MKTRVLLVTIFCFLLSVNVFATAQYPDKLIYDGKEYMLHTNPMEAYFAKFPKNKPTSGI